MKPRRVPVILQVAAADCGSACLAMIVRSFGRRISLSECRELCGAGRDGTTAESLVKAAREQGLHVRAVSLPSGDLSGLRLPAIAHWNHNHFIIVESWSPKSVRIIDPSLGRMGLAPAEFTEGFTGILLTFSDAAMMKPKEPAPRSPWAQFLSETLRSRGFVPLALQILCGSLLLQAFGLSVPLFTKILIDGVLPAERLGLLPMIGLAMLFWILAECLTSYLRSLIVLRLKTKLDIDITRALVSHLLKLPFAFFQERASGDLLMRVTSNASIREFLTNQTLSVLLDGGLVFTYLCVLLKTDLFFGLLASAVAAIQVIVMVITARRAYDLLQRDLAANAESHSFLVETITGIAYIKASGAEERIFNRWSQLLKRQVRVSFERGRLSAVVDTAMTALRTSVPLLLLWITVLRVLDGSVSLGAGLAMNALALSFLLPLASLVSSGQQFQFFKAQMNRIADVLEAAPEQESGVARTAVRVAGRIEVKNLSFRYAKNSPWVLRNISISIRPGQKVALVGQSGSGKSTLGMLLLALYIPTDGEICFDGVPLRNFDYRALRRQFGAVLQQADLFSGSIHSNIALNDPRLSRANVVEAARMAAIHTQISAMPMGYETRVAEGGGGFSGGQKQRLAIARAVAHKPAVLFLDEATSHLDTATEAEVHRNLAQIGCTTIIAAHRLSTVRDADLILFLEEGIIVESGAHDELLALDGKYAGLVRKQLPALSSVKEALHRLPILQR
jgi:ATP-binding cassette, subfamily B, bacterial